MLKNMYIDDLKKQDVKRLFEEAKQAITQNKLNTTITICDICSDEVGVLNGAPYMADDSICTKGVLSTAGSKALYNFVPPFGATVVDKLAKAGAKLVAKANMSEFGSTYDTENSFFGAVKNPNGNLTVGNSGLGVALNNGEAVFGVGDDCDGNLRLTACYTNNVAFKPAFGKVSRSGLNGVSSCMDQIAPIAKSLADAVAVANVIQGFDPKDSTSLENVYNDLTKGLGKDIKGLRLGVVKELMESASIQPKVKDAYDKMVAKLVEAGATIVEVSVPSTVGMLGALTIIKCAEVTSNTAKIDGIKFGYKTSNFENLVDIYFKTRSEGMGMDTKEAIVLGNFVVTGKRMEAYYLKARRVFHKLKDEYAKAFADCDVIVSPTAPSLPYVVGSKSAVEAIGETIFTAPSSVIGAPAVTLPIANGVGIHFFSNDEEKLITVASMTEKLAK